MDRSVDAKRLAAACTDKAEAREEEARRAKARRDAARFAGGVTSASGGGSGSVSTEETLLNT